MAELVRADVLRRIDAAFPRSPVILTLGGTAREMLAVAGRRPNHLVNLDGMGQTVSLAFGLALGREGGSAPGREADGGSALGREADGARRAMSDVDKVVAVEGDGSLLMGLSVLGTIGHLRPANLVVLVLDNGVYLATGGQPTASADLDMAAMARACGWPAARDVHTAEELAGALAWAGTAEGPILVRVYVGTEQLTTGYFLEDPVVLAEDFRRWLRSPDGGGSR